MGEWISVQDRLPDYLGDCLVWAHDQEGHGYLRIDTYSWRYGFLHLNVTHWMPLPAPPEDDQ